MESLTRIGIFYDGQLFYLVSNYYLYDHPRRQRLSIRGLHWFIRKKVSSLLRQPFDMCQIVNAQYFRGRLSARDADDRQLLYQERAFDDVLQEANITTHYRRLSRNNRGDLREKGVDVWLALEAYEMAVLNRCDVIVLLVNDGDYVPLLLKLQALGKQVVLLFWNIAYQTNQGQTKGVFVSGQLVHTASHAVNMHGMIENPANAEEKALADRLFLDNQWEGSLDGGDDDLERIGEDLAQDGLGSSQNRQGLDKKPDPPPSDRETALSEADQPERVLSFVVALKDGYGFIYGREHDVFFHHSTVANGDFADLRVDDPVEYIPGSEGFDANGNPTFTAQKVWMADL